MDQESQMILVCVFFAIVTAGLLWRDIDRVKKGKRRGHYE